MKPERFRIWMIAIAFIDKMKWKSGGRKRKINLTIMHQTLPFQTRDCLNISYLFLYVKHITCGRIVLPATEITMKYYNSKMKKIPLNAVVNWQIIIVKIKNRISYCMQTLRNLSVSLIPWFFSCNLIYKYNGNIYFNAHDAHEHTWTKLKL